MADREQVLFRLRDDDMKRLKRAVRASRGTMQSFLESLVMREINELEAKRRPAPQNEDPERVNPFTSSTLSKLPAGLGISERLRPLPPQHNDEHDPPAQAPVVVNVGSNAGGVPAGSSDIERLAAFVVAARDFERATRLRTAVGILHATASSEEERRVLGARLDEAIAAKTKAAAPDEGSPMRLARVAFDKLKDLF